LYSSRILKSKSMSSKLSFIHSELYFVLSQMKYENL
jgi:hypothetical protein